MVEYWLAKGRHYILNVEYLGGAHGSKLDDESSKCSTYDLTLSIVHTPTALAEATCKADSKNVVQWGPGLKHVIKDRDLNSSGLYSYDQVLRLRYPQDFHVGLK